MIPARVWTLLLVACVAAISTTASDPSPARAGVDVCPEPNGDSASACFIGTDSPVIGFLESAEDVDVYRLVVEGSDAKVVATLKDPPGDYRLRLHREDWSLVAETSTSGAVTKEIQAEPLHPGTYYLSVDLMSGEASADAPYVLGVQLQALVTAPPAVARVDSVPNPARAYLVATDLIPGFQALINDEQREERGTSSALRETRSDGFSMLQRAWVRTSEPVNRQVWESIRRLVSGLARVESLNGWVTENAYTWTLTKDGQLHRGIVFMHRNGMGEVAIWASPDRETWIVLSEMAAKMATAMLDSTN